MILRETLINFIRQSLSPEFLKGKSINSGHNVFGDLIIMIDNDNGGNTYRVISRENMLCLLIYKRSYRPINYTNIYLADPKVSEKIREFFERDPP